MATQLNDWLTVDKNSGTGNAEITLTASSYEELVDRATSLKIQGISANAILNVRQNALVPTITLSTSKIESSFESATYNVVVTSNVDWTLESDSNWYTISQNSGTKGNTTLIITMGENEGTDYKEGTVSFLFGDMVLATLSIVQDMWQPLPKADNRIYYTGDISPTADIYYGTNAEWVGFGTEDGVKYIEYDRPITQIMGNFMKGMSVKRVSLPSTLLYIYNVSTQNSSEIYGSEAFHTDTLEEVDFGGNELYIGNYAFYSRNLRRFELPSSVRIIGYCGFGGKNTTLNIGANCTLIAGGAFSNNTQLEDIYFYGINPPQFPNAATGGQGAFVGINENCIVHAPIGSDYSILYSDGGLPSTCHITYDLEAVQPTSYETSRFLDGGHIRVNPSKGAIVFFYNSAENKYTLWGLSGKNNYTEDVVENIYTEDGVSTTLEIRCCQGDIKIEQYATLNRFYVTLVNNVHIGSNVSLTRWHVNEWVSKTGFSFRYGNTLDDGRMIYYVYDDSSNSPVSTSNNYEYYFDFKDYTYDTTYQKRFKVSRS